MWSFFSSSPTKVLSIEEQLDMHIRRLNNFINAAIEASFSSGGSDVQLISSPQVVESFTSLLTVLLSEDTEHAEDQDFGAGMMWVLSQGLFDQLTAWAQLDQPPGMFSKVLFFFTMLVIDVKNQPILQHVGFNRALLSLLIITSERLKRGHVFAEAKETVVPFVHAICCRVTQDPSLSSCFVVKDDQHPQYILVPVLEYFLKTESREDVSALECVEMLGQTEDEDVLQYLLEESTLLNSVARRLVRYLVNLPKTAVRPSSQCAKTREMEELCKYLRYLDSFCRSCLRPSLVRSLVQSLLSDCFQPYIAPNIRSTEMDRRCLFTLYLLHIVRECRSKDILSCVALMLRGSDAGQHSHGRFESTSTMSGPRGMTETSQIGQDTMWEAFLSNLRSENTTLRTTSLKLLYHLISCNQWEVVHILVSDTFQGCAPTEFMRCSYERFLSFFPAGLLHSDMKSAPLYYYESMNQVLEETLPLEEKRDERVTDSIGKAKGDIDEGPVLKFLFEKLGSLLANNVEENLLVTGVLTCLSRIPALNSAASNLNYVLFSTTAENSLFTVLRKIDSRILRVAEETSNFESALYGAKKALGLEVDASLHADKNYTELILKRQSGTRIGNTKKIRDTHFIEGVVLYQEFVRELAGCVLAQEQMTIMRDCSRSVACN